MPASPTLDLHVQQHTIEQGFTQSELSLMDECKLKWNLRYNNLLKRADQYSWALAVGTSWHAFQEEWRKTKGECDLTKVYGSTPVPKEIAKDSEFDKWLEYWTDVLPAYQKQYAKMYQEEATHDWLIVEQELSAEYLGYKIRGMVDLASDKPRFIRDFKSTVSAWLIAPSGWHFKLQFMTYCWLMSKNHKSWQKQQFQFQMDIMQKPGLKETKADGTWAGHIRRVCADVATRPEYYLTRQSSLITPEQIQRFETNVLTPKIQTIALAVDNPEEGLAIITNPNTNACNLYGNQCEFFEVCEKGWEAGKFFLTNRTQKHEEL